MGGWADVSERDGDDDDDDCSGRDSHSTSLAGRKGDSGGSGLRFQIPVALCNYKLLRVYAAYFSFAPPFPYLVQLSHIGTNPDHPFPFQERPGLCSSISHDSCENIPTCSRSYRMLISSSPSRPFSRSPVTARSSICHPTSIQRACPRSSHPLAPAPMPPV